MQPEFTITTDKDGANAVRYVRGKGQWVKITRNRAQRKFHLARGWTGETTAHARETWDFAHLPTWSDAIDLAKQAINDYA